MELILLGIDISAGAGLLERLSALVDPVSDTLLDLSELTDEALVLSTCNRVEFYAVVPAIEDGTAALDDYLLARGVVAASSPHSGVYRMQGREAAAHLFMVTAGLKSMVPGDAQITGQVREALKQAMSAGTAGQILRLAFEHALKASRNVRANARATSHTDSVAAASIEIISDSPIPMSELNAVVVGAGNTGALAARLLTERGVRNITIANRSIERAREVAASVGGKAIGLSELASVLNNADVVISSTGAPHHVITSGDLIRAGIDQRVHPMLIIDMAVPNDVEPSASELPGVDLYDIYRIGDSLRHKSPDSAFACEGDAFAAIQEQVIHFETGSRAARRGVLIQNVVAESKSVRETELERATRALERQGIDTRCLLPILDAMANSITKKLLHTSITHIRESESEDSALAVMQLFGNRPSPGLASPTTSTLAA